MTAETALVGHGGWGDARAGNPATSDVILNDFLRIEELRQAYVGGTRSDDTPLPDTLRAALRRLGDEAGAHLRRVVPAALAGHDHVLVLMHVPPFIEACWHHGAISDDNWAPHFTCVAAGDALRDCMAVHPAKRMTVLCGHTHSAGTARILPNLDVVTGDAEYGHPKVHRVFDV